MLSAYTFTTHTYKPPSVASLRRLHDLCLAYQLRIIITHLVLGPGVRVVDFDHARPYWYPFPASLTSLRIGQYRVEPAREVDWEQHWAALSAAACHWQHTKPWQLPHSHPQAQAHGSEGQRWQQPPWCSAPKAELGSLQCRLPPGLLPRGLRVLQLHSDFNHRLEPASLPSSLISLELGVDIDQPLPAGMLQASLLHLTLGYGYRQPLGPGSLPPSLERLILRGWLPLSAVVLPPSLRALHLHDFSQPLLPNAPPPSLLYLSLEQCYHPVVTDALLEPHPPSPRRRRLQASAVPRRAPQLPARPQRPRIR